MQSRETSNHMRSAVSTTSRALSYPIRALEWWEAPRARPAVKGALQPPVRDRGRGETADRRQTRSRVVHRGHPPEVFCIGGEWSNLFRILSQRVAPDDGVKRRIESKVDDVKRWCARARG